MKQLDAEFLVQKEQTKCKISNWTLNLKKNYINLRIAFRALNDKILSKNL